jgi:hypothetical protein
MRNLIPAVIAWLRVIAHRRHLYQVAIPAIALLAAVGVIAPAHVEAWLALAQALLGVTAGVLAAANASAAWRWWLYSVAAGVSGVLVILTILPSTTASLLLTVVSAALSITGGGVSLAHLPKTPPPGPQLQDGGR